LFLFYFFFSDLLSLFLCLPFFPSSGVGRLWGQGVCGLWSAGFVYSVVLGLLDLEPGFVARAADRPRVWMAGSATSLLPLHFYTGVVVYCRHGWEIGAPSSFGFLLPTFSWLSFGWVLWRPGEQGGWVVVGLFGWLGQREERKELLFGCWKMVMGKRVPLWF
jgi:hypothetical protein